MSKDKNILAEKDRNILAEIQELYAKLEKNKVKHTAKILVFDIETSPMKSYHWGMWQQNINTDAIVDDWFVISWAAKWLLEDEEISQVLSKEEVLNKDDSRIVKGLWEMLNEADIVIAHNGKKFDVKKINTRFFLQDMFLPSPYKVIDTLQQVRGVMSLPSNRLDFIGKITDLGGKMEHTGLKLWLDCLEGDESALKMMDDYCKRDVKLLEDVYLKLRPYMKNHPNLGIYVQEDLSVCPSCASTDLTEKGFNYTTSRKYKSSQCNSCGAWCASKVAETKENNLVNKTISNK